ncbi:MAG: PAS domain S-box protein [Sedimentisphaerales bacterium]
MSAREPTYEELQKRLAEAERTIRVLQDKQAGHPCGQCDHLHTCERRYRDLVENLVDVVFTLDTMGYITSINTSVRQMLGYEPDEFIGEHFIKWIAQDQKSVIMSVFERLLNGETIIDETILVGRDGKAHNVEFRATCIAREGTVLGVQGILRDITEQKEAQETLRRAEEKYRMLIEGTLDAIVVADAETGLILDCNRAATELTGREKAELIGQSHKVYHLPEECKEPFSETFKQHLAEKRGQTLDTQIVTKAGQKRDVAIKAHVVEIGGREVMLGLFRDISEHKRAEADLRKSEERFKRVVEIAGDWVWEVDTEGMYTYASPVVERVLGYKPEEIIGKKHFYDFFSPETREDLKKAAFEAFARRESFTGFVNHNVHRDGSVVIIETSGIAIVDEEGMFCGYRGVDRDVTERRRREDELQKMNEDLVLASRKAGMAEVATDVLHNVANVLNSINVSADFIEERLSNSKATNLKKVTDMLAEHTNDIGTFLTEDERGRHIPVYLTEAARLIVDEQTVIADKLKSLTKNVQHVTQIIKAQQSYARSGGVEAFTRPREIIEDAIEINHAALERYGIELQCELAELPRVRMDRQRILQILVNLITNGKQALVESNQPNKVLTIRCARDGRDKLRIEVVDNGVGISKEHQPLIFTHGFTTKRGGHGFGLHGSALAAREMGGSLSVHSDGPGHGATFTLEIPLKLEATTDGRSS